MKNKSAKKILNSNGQIEPPFLTRNYKFYLPQFFVSNLINNHGLVLNLVSQNRMRYVLQSVVRDRGNQ